MHGDIYPVCYYGSSTLGFGVALIKKGISRAPKLPADFWLYFRKAKKVAGKIMGPDLILGCICGTTGWLIFALALTMGPVVIVQPLLNLATLSTLAVAVLYLREKLRWFEFFGVTLVFLGDFTQYSCRVSRDQVSESIRALRDMKVSREFLFGMMAGCFYGLGWFLIKVIGGGGVNCSWAPR